MREKGKGKEVISIGEGVVSGDRSDASNYYDLIERIAGLVETDPEEAEKLIESVWDPSELGEVMVKLLVSVAVAENSIDRAERLVVRTELLRRLVRESRRVRKVTTG